FLAKMKRLVGVNTDDVVATDDDEEQEEYTPPTQRRVVKQLPPMRPNQFPQTGFTDTQIAQWFHEGRIDKTEFFALLNRIDNPQATERDRDRDRHADTVEHEPASEANGATQMETLRPPGWDEEKEQRLIGAYIINGNYCKCLEPLGFSDTQRN